MWSIKSAGFFVLQSVRYKVIALLLRSFSDVKRYDDKRFALVGVVHKQLGKSVFALMLLPKDTGEDY